MASVSSVGSVEERELWRMRSVDVREDERGCVGVGDGKEGK